VDLVTLADAGVVRLVAHGLVEIGLRDAGAPHDALVGDAVFRSRPTHAHATIQLECARW
jgi:hypothetical protein